MNTEQQKLFLWMMTSLFHVQQSVADSFFKKRLNEEIEQVMDKHIQYLAHPAKESQREYIWATKSLNKVLEEIIYLEKGDTISLAVAHERVLQHSYNLLKEIRTSKQISVETEIVPILPELVPHSTIPNKPIVVAPKPVRIKSLSVHAGRLTKTQESILEFVRQEPDCRTKDVISQFSALSQRTIKRGLKELNEEGRIIKRLDGVAVYYSAV